jgi:hypothetical protein
MSAVLTFLENRYCIKNRHRLHRDSKDLPVTEKAGKADEIS